MNHTKDARTPLTHVGLSIRVFFMSLLLMGSSFAFVSTLASSQIFAQGAPKIVRRHVTGTQSVAALSTPKKLHVSKDHLTTQDLKRNMKQHGAAWTLAPTLTPTPTTIPDIITTTTTMSNETLPIVVATPAATNIAPSSVLTGIVATPVATETVLPGIITKIVATPTATTLHDIATAVAPISNIIATPVVGTTLTPTPTLATTTTPRSGVVTNVETTPAPVKTPAVVALGKFCPLYLW